MNFIYAIFIGIVAGFVISKIDTAKIKFNTVGTVAAGVIGALIPVFFIEFAILGDRAIPILEVTEVFLGSLLATVNAFLFAGIYRALFRSRDIFQSVKKMAGYTPSTETQASYSPGMPAYIGIKDGLSKKQGDEQENQDEAGRNGSQGSNQADIGPKETSNTKPMQTQPY